LHGAYERDSKGTDTEMANWVQTAHPLAYYWYLFYFPFKMRLTMLPYLHGKTTKNR
jgi:hypothetical protein